MNSIFFKSLFTMLSGRGLHRKLTILFLHRVIQDDLRAKGDLNVANFENLLDFLEEHMHVIPLGEAVERLKHGTLPPRALSLTFDDGYADWVEVIAPSLRRRNLHATFFVSTEQLSGPDHWNERIVSAVRGLPAKNAILPFAFGRYSDLDIDGRRSLLIEDLQARFKYLTLSDRKSAIDQLERQVIQPIFVPRRFDIASLRDLHGQGFGIGAHTIHHPILNECSSQEALAEIGGSKEILQELIKSPIELFAYPNGKPQRDYSNEHVKMVQSCGYRAAFSTSGGVATCSSDIFQLPRFAPWAFQNARLAYQLAVNIQTRKKYSVSKPIAKDSHNTEVKVLLIASTFSPIHGGSAVVYESLCRNLPIGSIRVLSAKRNYLNGKEVAGWEQNDSRANYPIHRVDLLRPPMLPPPRNLFVSAFRFLSSDLVLYGRILLQTSKIVRQHKINVVCVGELVTGSWLGAAMRKLFGCKFIVYVHGEEITTATIGRLHGNQRAYYLNTADRIIAVSSFTCDALTSLMNVSPGKIELIHNGVDTTRFSPGRVPEYLVHRYGLEGKRIVLTVGRMVPRKGIDMAIKAVNIASAQVSNIHHLIVGDGPMRIELQELVKREQLCHLVTIVGGVTDNELVDFFRVCELFLLPNRTMDDGDTEGFGLVFREANACGKAVIGGNAGGVVEAVVDGDSGLLVDGTDLTAIADAIQRVLLSSELQTRLAENGLKLAQSNDTKTAADKFLRTCERLLVQ